MRSIDYVMNALNDNDSEEAAKRAMEQAAASRRASGSVGRIGSSSPSIDANMLKMARESNAAAPAVDNDYLGVAEEARDDGSHAPEAAKAYLAYQNDPQYQQLETAKRLAMEKMSGAGAGMLNRITHGGHLESARSTYDMAERSQKMIQQRYLDNLRATLASQPTPEDFDPSKARNEYNRDKGIWEKIITGDRGGTRVAGQTTGPIEKYVDQYGRQGSYEVRPGTTPMVRTDKSVQTTSESISVPGFEGGVAEGLQPMEPLGTDPKTQSEIDENKAQRDAAGALAESRGVVEVSPGGSVFDTKSKKKLFTAQLTPSQANSGGTSSGKDNDGKPTEKDIETLAGDRAKKALSGIIDSTSPDYSKRYDDKVEYYSRMLRHKYGYDDAPKAGIGDTQQRTLRDGTKVTVRRNAQGKWEEVR